MAERLCLCCAFMIPNNTLDLDSLRRFIHALTPAIHDLLAMTDRLRLEPGEFTPSHAARLHDTAELLQALQSEFLALIALETREYTPRPQVVDMQTLCLAVADLLSEHAHPQRIHVDVQVSPDLRAWTDPALCSHILRRLLSNALRYNRTAGRVVLSARATGSGGVLLRVADSGAGMNLEQRRVLFAPFERLGKELCAADGTGMGLAMAQRMAAQLGTQLVVRSRPGRGSIFRLILPRAYPQTSQGH